MRDAEKKKKKRNGTRNSHGRGEKKKKTKSIRKEEAETLSDSSCAAGFQKKEKGEMWTLLRVKEKKNSFRGENPFIDLKKGN